MPLQVFLLLLFGFHCIIIICYSIVSLSLIDDLCLARLSTYSPSFFTIGNKRGGWPADSQTIKQQNGDHPSWVQQREEKRWSLSSPIIKPPFMHFSFLSFYYYYVTSVWETGREKCETFEPSSSPVWKKKRSSNLGRRWIFFFSFFFSFRYSSSSLNFFPFHFWTLEIQSGQTGDVCLPVLYTYPAGSPYDYGQFFWWGWWCEKNLVMAVINHGQTWRPL